MKSRRFSFRRPFLLFLPFLTTLLLGLCIFSLPPTYTATASIHILEDTVATDIGVERSDSALSPAQQNAQAFNQYKLLPDFLRRVQENAKLSQPINFNAEKKDPRAERLVYGLNAYEQSENLMGINLIWDNPDECNRLVKAASEEFKQIMVNERMASSTQKVMFVSQEIEDEERRIKIQEIQEREHRRKQTASPFPDPNWSDAVQKAIKDENIAQLRKFLAMRNDFTLKAKLQTAFASVMYQDANPPHAVPVIAPTKIGITLSVGFLFGGLLSLILIALRSISERRAGKVKPNLETLPAKERTDDSSDSRTIQEAPNDGRDL